MQQDQVYRATPEPGQLVEVRRRQWIVAEVESSKLTSTSFPQNAVTLSSIDEDGLGEELEVIWEYLFTRTGLTASVLPGWDNLSSRCTP